MGTIFLPRALSALGQSTLEMGPAAVLTKLVSPADYKINTENIKTTMLKRLSNSRQGHKILRKIESQN